MLNIRATLLCGSFDGGDSRNPNIAEWPPSWMRLFSAMVSVAKPADDNVLRLLEKLPPPDIACDVENTQSRRQAYVPTNHRGTQTKHSTWPARTNSERAWPRVFPRNPVVEYRFPGVDLSVDDSDLVRGMLRRIPYLGRTTSPAIIELTEPQENHPQLTPAQDGASQDFVFATTVRSPYEGSLDALRNAHHRKYHQGLVGDPWDIGRGVDYGIQRPRVDEEVVASPFEPMIVLRLVSRRLDARLTGRITHNIRRALMSRADEPIGSLHGHNGSAGGRVGIISLPVVDERTLGDRLSSQKGRSNGHVVGVGLTFNDVSNEDKRLIVEALPETGEILSVKAGPLGVLTLERMSPLDLYRNRTMGLRTSRWERPSTTWVSATPMVLDRHPGRREPIASVICETFETSGYPRPIAGRVSKYPLIDGAPRMTPKDTLRRADDKNFRPYRHVIVRFDRPVAGPMLVGAMRYYGIGLFVPYWESSEQ